MKKSTKINNSHNNNWVSKDTADFEIDQSQTNLIKSSLNSQGLNNQELLDANLDSSIEERLQDLNCRLEKIHKNELYMTASIESKFNETDLSQQNILENHKEVESGTNEFGTNEFGTNEFSTHVTKENYKEVLLNEEDKHEINNHSLEGIKTIEPFVFETSFVIDKKKN